MFHSLHVTVEGNCTRHGIPNSHQAHRNEIVSDQKHKYVHINYDSMKVWATTSRQLVNVYFDARGPKIHSRNRQTTQTDHRIAKHAHQQLRFAPDFGVVNVFRKRALQHLHLLRAQPDTNAWK